MHKILHSVTLRIRHCLRIGETHKCKWYQLLRRRWGSYSSRIQRIFLNRRRNFWRNWLLVRRVCMMLSALNQKFACRVIRNRKFSVFVRVLTFYQVESTNHHNLFSTGFGECAERCVLHCVSARFCIHSTEDDAQHSDAGYSQRATSLMRLLVILWSGHGLFRGTRLC